MKKFALLVLISSLSLACGNKARPAQSAAQTRQDAIRTAIQAHLAHQGNLDLQAFDTVVTQVTIQGSRATADVEFRLKNSPGAMQLTYSLEQRDGTWSVVDSNPTGSNLSHPPVDQAQTAQPNGSPAASHPLADTLKAFGLGGSGSPSLPSGHPPITKGNDDTQVPGVP